MNELVDQLVSVVAEEAEQFERLLALLRQQHRRLVCGDVAGLNRSADDQEEALRVARVLERRRHDLLERLAACPPGDESTDYARLVAALSHDYARRFADLRCALKGSISQLQKTREQNARLIARSLSSVSQRVGLRATTPAGSDCSVPQTESRAPSGAVSK